MHRQENGTLPRGPDEVGEVWSAQSRLGYSLHGIKAWGHGLPANGVFITTISRVVEKTSLWTVCVIERALQLLEERYGIFAGCEEFVTWYDAGPHYRCRQFLGSLCVTFIEQFKPKDALLHTCARFGLEHHLKDDLDRWFGELDGRILRQQTHRWICTIDDLVEVFREEGSTKPPGLFPVELFDDFMPTIRKQDFAKTHPALVAASLPAPVKSCHEWECRLLDARRKQMLGRDGVSITGVECRASRLPHMHSQLEWTHCRVDTGRVEEPKALDGQEDREEDEKDVEQPTVDKASQVAMLTNEHLGWRTSYRQMEPEMPNRARTLATLQWKTKFVERLRLRPAQRVASLPPEPWTAKQLQRKKAALKWISKPPANSCMLSDR